MKETTLTETERVRRLQDKEAPRYDRQMGFFDRILFADGREWACSRVEGDVLELAVGTGRNLPYYPADVRLTGIELSPQMLEIGKKRADELGRDVDLRIGDAQALASEDQSFDTVIITFGLCTIPDDRGAVGEAHRVLRPGGRLVLLEHVRSPSLAVRAVQAHARRAWLGPGPRRRRQRRQRSPEPALRTADLFERLRVADEGLGARSRRLPRAPSRRPGEPLAVSAAGCARQGVKA
jgi:ubiquinone/menaquinone biosynthesis C-methylase UbiE